MPNAEELRAIVNASQGRIVRELNAVLRGRGLRKYERILARIARSRALPHWFEQLKNTGTLPNLDGKTIGSVVEMLLVAVLEGSVLAGEVGPMRINPARGVDLPDLHLGVKSPSKNLCTSEPFFSAYQRLLGSDHDLLVLLTDYQEGKRAPPLRLQILDSRYLTKTQVADRGLCAIARLHREWLLGYEEASAQKLFRFLAYVNQSDWRAKFLMKLVHSLQSEHDVDRWLSSAVADFATTNERAAAAGRSPLPESDLQSILRVRDISPRFIGILDATENWVLETLRDAARAPSADEWNRLRAGPLDGKISMSFALQWRYSFKPLFPTQALDE